MDNTQITATILVFLIFIVIIYGSIQNECAYPTMGIYIPNDVAERRNIEEIFQLLQQRAMQVNKAPFSSTIQSQELRVAKDRLESIAFLYAILKAIRYNTKPNVYRVNTVADMNKVYDDVLSASLMLDEMMNELEANKQQISKLNASIQMLEKYIDTDIMSMYIEKQAITSRSVALNQAIETIATVLGLTKENATSDNIVAKINELKKLTITTPTPVALPPPITTTTPYPTSTLTSSVTRAVFDNPSVAATLDDARTIIIDSLDGIVVLNAPINVSTVLDAIMQNIKRSIPVLKTNQAILLDHLVLYPAINTADQSMLVYTPPQSTISTNVSKPSSPITEGSTAAFISRPKTNRKSIQELLLKSPDKSIAMASHATKIAAFDNVKKEYMKLQDRLLSRGH